MPFKFSRRYKAKFAMVIFALVFGVIAPAGLTIEPYIGAAFWAVALGTLPTYIVFLHLYKKHFFKVEDGVALNYVEIFSYAAMFSITFNGPILMVNKYVGKPKEIFGEGVVVEKQDSYMRRKNIYPPFVKVRSDKGKYYSLVQERMILDSVRPGDRVRFQLTQGSLGYLLEGYVAKLKKD